MPGCKRYSVPAMSAKGHDHGLEAIGAILGETSLRSELLSDRELDASVGHALRGLGRGEDAWLFAYGSLIWNPSFRHAERRRALLQGYHRGFYLHSRINRGTPQQPGLVLGLDRGGSCRGLVYRIEAAHVKHEFRLLWRREMPLGSYDPQWLTVHARGKPVRALAFLVRRRASAYAGRLSDEEIVTRLSNACGIYGSGADYLIATAEGLARCGIRDAYVERLRELMRHSRRCNDVD
jgi:cation transport protein ChaC